MSRGLAALCLAAGRGTRLAPITDRTPKPLCPAGDVRLLDRALMTAAKHTDRIAVNAHHLADQIEAHVAVRRPATEVVVEQELLGTGGAVGNVSRWLGDDDLMVVNSDTVLLADTDEFVGSWDRSRLRMVVVADQARPDFLGAWRYAGVSLVPNEMARALPAAPANLSDELFRPAWRSGRVDLVPVAGFYMDCATPRDLLVANLALSGGETVVAEGAELGGHAEWSLLMPGSRVHEGERLEWAIRLGDGSTIDCRP
jgi:NDP-sugar pyrophosphorylase family protein